MMKVRKAQKPVLAKTAPIMLTMSVVSETMFIFLPYFGKGELERPALPVALLGDKVFQLKVDKQFLHLRLNNRGNVSIDLLTLENQGDIDNSH
jgi:hypothetical protein